MLRGRQVMLAKFRRQHPIGLFIVDFFCKEAGLVVEADGAPHFPRPRRDRRRDAWLAGAGLVVLRLPNHLILHHPDRALCQIRGCLAARLPAPLSDPGEGLGVRLIFDGCSGGKRPCQVDPPQGKQELIRERALVEGSIGTIKCQKYGFNRPAACSAAMMGVCGQRAALGFNLSKLVHCIARKQRLTLAG